MIALICRRSYRLAANNFQLHDTILKLKGDVEFINTIINIYLRSSRNI
jgi:hypothetical protein